MFALKKLPKCRYPGTIIRQFAAATEARQYVDPELESAKPYEEIPTLSIWIFTDMLPGGALHGKTMDEWMPYFQKKFGSIYRFKPSLGRPESVTVHNPEDVKKVYRFDGQWPHRMGFDSWTYWRQQRKDLFNNFEGLVLQQGEKWQKYRTILNPVMMQPKTVSLYVPEIDQVARDFVQLTKKSLDANSETPADFGAYIQRFTLEAIGFIALEARLNVLDAKEGDKGAKLAQLVDEIFTLTFELEVMPSIWRYVKTPTFHKLMKTFDEAALIINEYIDEALVKFEKSGSSKSEEVEGVLYKLLKIDRECGIIMAMDMISVGIDTTSSTIKSLLYLLAANPAKQEKLRKEILTILPNKTDLLTPEKMKSLPYLRACMKESQRLMPTVSGNARRLPQDLVLSGYRVPKGIDVILPHGSLGLEETLFPRPQEFIPERWLKDESHAQAVNCPHAKTAHPFAYLPFGFGTRACIGKRFADLETSTLAIRMVREFEISWPYEPPKTAMNIIKQIIGDMKFRMKQLD